MGNSLGNSILFPAPPCQYNSHLKNLIPLGDPRRSTKHALYFFQDASRPTMIYLHGNSCNLGQLWSELELYSSTLRVNLLAPEYPGYGIESSPRTSEGIDTSALLAWNHARDTLRVNNSNLIVFGCSIGTGPACRLALRIGNLGGLVLQSPFTSIDDMVSEKLSWMGFVGKGVVGNPWDNAEMLKQLMRKMGERSPPLLVIHGTRDEVIPYSQGCALAESYLAGRWTLRSGPFGHNDYNIDFVSEVIQPIVDDIALNANAPINIALNANAPINMRERQQSTGNNREEPTARTDNMQRTTDNRQQQKRTSDKQLEQYEPRHNG